MQLRPLILSTWSFGLRGNAAAWPALRDGGTALDAVEAACRVVEADPEVDSVGYGGLPDREGSVSLDACVMLSPSRCGSVVNVRRHLHVTTLARAVMERTPHVMLAGQQADEFADSIGMPRQELLAPAARQRWEQWTKDQQRPDQARDSGKGLRPVDRGGAGIASGRLFDHESRWAGHDTIGSLALDSRGLLAGACSTSGTPFKVPGRVGDSPIIGHGLYVDPRIGAATATGTGELIMGVCGSFLVVELMRRGDSPLDALRQALARMIDSYDLSPQHQVAMIALRADGQWAAAALRPGYYTAVRTSQREEAAPPELVMLPG